MTDDLDQVLSFDLIPNFKTFDGINKKKSYGQRALQATQRGDLMSMMASMGLDGANRQKSPELGNDRRPIRFKDVDALLNSTPQYK